MWQDRGKKLEMRKKVGGLELSHLGMDVVKRKGSKEK